MRTLGHWIVVLLAIIGGITGLAIAAGTYAILSAEPEQVTLAENSHLVLDLDRGVADTATDDPFAALTGEQPYNLSQTVLALHQAANDPKITGLVAHMGSVSFQPATAQELMGAIAAFRHAGKPAMVFSESLDGGLTAVAVASSFSDIWLQPSGMFSLQGLAIEAPFLKAALSEYGIEADIIQRHEYKGALEFLSRDGMSAPVRQNMGLLLDDISDVLTQAIADNRTVSKMAVNKRMETGPLLAAEARAANLVDHLAYRDDFRKAVKSRFTGQAVTLGTYLEAREQDSSAPRIALVQASGQIIPGAKNSSPFADNNLIMARSTAKAIQDAAKAGVGAIILRINSPGGDYAASDTIRQAIVAANAQNIPVIVSMEDYAASGGYFIASAADTIIAQPTTITGSIGVIAGKVNLQKAWDKLGISWETLKTGETAGMWSMNKGFTQTERNRMNKIIDAAYMDFTAKVAEGRKLDMDAVDMIARGRVFSGERAKSKQLVDDLGGIITAVAHAKRVAGVPAENDIQLVQFPEVRPFHENLIAWMQGNGDNPFVTSQLRSALPEPVSTLYQWSLIRLENGAALMPPMRIQ